ncbi:hypothetical protein SFC57_23990 [Niallia circulans]|uniref:hypothetical protein n=1 Tax=Bacillaceae TaxID=186817 RepID=UPI00397CEC80
MKNVKTIYTEYVNKSFQIPKALFFGKYEGLSMKARFYLAFFKEISKVSDSGLLFLNVKDMKGYEDVIKELQEYELILLSNNHLYFLDIQIDNEIIKRIQDLEQNKEITIKDDKEKSQEKLIEQAFFENEDLPERLTETLRVFSKNIDEAQQFFEIIMKAKKKVENETEQVIWLDHDDEMLDVIVNSFSRSIRKVNKENIKNKNGYIYKAIYINISQKVQQRTFKKESLINWLEE